MDPNEGTGASKRDFQSDGAAEPHRRAEQEFQHSYEQLHAVFTLSATAGRATSLVEIYGTALDRGCAALWR